MDGELAERVAQALAKLDGEEDAVEVVEVYWNDDWMQWLPSVAAIVKRPSFAHPSWTAVDLVHFDDERPETYAKAVAVAERLAERLAVPLHSVARPEPADWGRWLDDQPTPERSWTVRWLAQARHCVHSAAEEPVELEGDVEVRDCTPGGALAAAKKHALDQLPQGEDWRREAAVSLVIGDVELRSGKVWPIRGGDAPL